MRIRDEVFVEATSVVLPIRRQTIRQVDQPGGLSLEQAEKLSGVTEVPVADHAHCRELMAVTAAHDVLASPRGAQDVGLVICAWVLDTDNDWKLAPRLARKAGARGAVAIGVRQLSNGGAMGVQIAAAQMMAEASLRAALVLTGDALGPDAPGRWAGAEGAFMGDAATALLLSRTQGRLAVRSIASSGRCEHEAELPTANPLLGPPPSASAAPAKGGSGSFLLRRCVRDAVQRALADAGLDADDARLRIMMLPRLAPWLLDVLMTGLLPESLEAEQLRLTAQTGHLFAGDMTANLDHLLREDALEVGQYALLVSVGSGFTATCLVVQAVSPLTDTKLPQKGVATS
ncbi:3-oxoacyl-[acyl-carrier-protein] synthase III C-terminal domain-containing protein [Streptomyces sp. NPDC023327]|uniref:3-oxoacyl-[acyl-carrier-protein] synthase III C-terminal domain-containing protein n=1 Tax=Streptomyces sp. NPDC023327 TaxID=3157088 RepID=UPI0033D75455